MRLDANSKHEVAVALSRRNLLALLERVYDPARSTISGPLRARDGFPVFVKVTAETDEKHYAGRDHGALHLRAGTVLQIAVDFLNQIEDSLSDSEDDRFMAAQLERLANQIGYLSAQDGLAARKLEVT